MARREWQNPSVLERESKAGREWYIRYRVKVLEYAAGKPVIRRREKWVALGLCAKMTKRQAEREKDRIMRGVNAQVYTVRSQIPWTQFVKVFDETHIASLAVPTQITYRSWLGKHITPAFEKLHLGQIGALEIEQLFRSMEAAGIARSTRQSIRVILSSAFKCAKRWKFLEGPSPLEDVSIGGGARHVRETKIPALEDVERLIDACDGDVPLLIETLIGTGMRISEAAGLVVSDLDFARGLIFVTRRRSCGDVAQPKSEAGRRELPMGDLARALREHVAFKQPADPVFTHPAGKPISGSRLLGDYLTPRMVELGIKYPGFGWHTFRRLHLSMMDQRGLSLFELRRQAGHADVRTTQRYIADDVARRAAAAEKPFLLRKGA